MNKEEIITLLNLNKINEAYNKIKSNITESLIDGNSFLHLLAIRGNDILLDIISKLDTKIYSKPNERGENILHLAFKNGYDELGLKMIKFDSELIEFQNNQYHFPTFYIVSRVTTLEKVISILIDNGYTDQFNAIDDERSNLIIEIITEIRNQEDDKIKLKYIEIIKKIFKYIDFEQPTFDSILNIIILQRNQKLIDFCINKNAGINFPNEIGLTPLNALISISDDNNIDVILIIKKLLKSKKFNREQLNRSGTKNDFLSVNQCLDLILEKPELKEKMEKILLLLLKYINNFTVFDVNRNTYGIFLADIVYNKKIDIDEKIQDIIFSKSDKKFMNIDGLSINSIQNKIDVDKCSLEPVKNIIFPEIKKKVNHVIFNTDVVHNMLYFIYLLNKYKNLCVPTSKKKIKLNKSNKSNDTHIKSKDIENSIKIKQNIINLVELLNEYFRDISPSLILWYNNEINFIHPKLKDSIQQLLENKECRYIVIKVSMMRTINMLHANVILFDKNDYTYRRFEPYGSSVGFDIELLDKYILQIFYSLTKHNIKYYRPADYLEVARFQSVSNETDITNRNVGDPFGFCLAWCIWYIEIKVSNPNLSEKDLIKKAADKIFIEYCDSNSPYNDFIRDYAAMLDKEKNGLLNKFKLNYNDYYKKSFTEDQLVLISEGIKTYI